MFHVTAFACKETRRVRNRRCIRFVCDCLNSYRYRCNPVCCQDWRPSLHTKQILLRHVTSFRTNIFINHNRDYDVTMEQQALLLPLEAMAITTKDDKPKERAQLPPNPRIQWNRKASFFDLPQLIRQKILYDSLPVQTIASIAQIALRMSQDAYLDREEQGRYVSNGKQADHDRIFDYFIKLYCKKVAVHWIIFHDLILVRKMWLAAYTRFPRIYEDFDMEYDAMCHSSKPVVGYRTHTNASAFSPEGALRKIEVINGIDSSKRRHRLRKVEERTRKWVVINSVRSITWKEKQRADAEDRGLVTNLKFDLLCAVTFLPKYGPPPTLKWHESKAYPTLSPSNPNRPFLPFELLRPILTQLFPEDIIDRLTKIQFHHQLTATRFVAAYVYKLSQIHPGLIGELHWLENYVNEEIKRRIKNYRDGHQERVQKYQGMLENVHNGLLTDEEADAYQDAVHKAMGRWRAGTYDLNLMGLEDQYGIEDKHRSATTRQLRAEMRKNPEYFVGTVRGKYRYALGTDRFRYKREEVGCNIRPWMIGRYGYREWWDDDD